VGGWTTAEWCCWLYRVTAIERGARAAIGVPASGAATVPDAAHGAVCEQSEGGQCGQSWSDPRVQEGLGNGFASCSAWTWEPWSTVEWLSQWRTGTGKAEAMLVLSASTATTRRRATRCDCGVTKRHLIHSTIDGHR
jgi:hypothetical protein